MVPDAPGWRRMAAVGRTLRTARRTMMRRRAVGLAGATRRRCRPLGMARRPHGFARATPCPPHRVPMVLRRAKGCCQRGGIAGAGCGARPARASGRRMHGRLNFPGPRPFHIRCGPDPHPDPCLGSRPAPLPARDRGNASHPGRPGPVHLPPARALPFARPVVMFADVANARRIARDRHPAVRPARASPEEIA